MTNTDVNQLNSAATKFHEWRIRNADSWGEEKGKITIW